MVQPLGQGHVLGLSGQGAAQLGQAAVAQGLGRPDHSGIAQTQLPGDGRRRLDHDRPTRSHEMVGHQALGRAEHIA